MSDYSTFDTVEGITPDKADEVYSRADQALAHLNVLGSNGDPHAQEIRQHLELIRRRTDPEHRR